MNDIRDVEILEFSDGNGGKRKYRLITPTDGSTPKSLYNVRLQAFDKRTKRRLSVNPKMILEKVPKPPKPEKQVVVATYNGNSLDKTFTELYNAALAGKLVCVNAVSRSGDMLTLCRACSYEMVFTSISGHNNTPPQGYSLCLTSNNALEWQNWSTADRNYIDGWAHLTAKNSGFYGYLGNFHRIDIASSVENLNITFYKGNADFDHFPGPMYVSFTVPEQAELKNVALFAMRDSTTQMQLSVFGMPAKWKVGSTYLIRMEPYEAEIVELCNEATRYAPMEYIANGGKGVIDIPVFLQANHKVEVVFSSSTVAENDFEALFGVRSGINSRAYAFFTCCHGNVNKQCYARGNHEEFAENLYTPGEKVRLVCNGLSATVYDMSGTVLGTINNSTGTLDVTGGTPYLFDLKNGSSRDNSWFHGKVYSFRIYDQNDTLLFDGVPVSDNGNPGLLDNVTGKFYQSMHSSFNRDGDSLAPPPDFQLPMKPVSTVPLRHSDVLTVNASGPVGVDMETGVFTDFGTIGAGVTSFSAQFVEPDDGYVVTGEFQFTLPSAPAFASLYVYLGETACKMSNVPDTWEAGKTYQVSVRNNCAFVSFFD